MYFCSAAILCECVGESVRLETVRKYLCTVSVYVLVTITFAYDGWLKNS